MTMSENKGTYSVTALCSNCGKQNTAYIEKGVLCDGHTEECTKCGCIVRFESHKSVWRR